MTFRDLAVEARTSLAADRRQTLLATLGLAFGIGVIVAALAVGDGARREALAEVQAMGVDNVIVRSVAPAPTGPARPAGPRLAIADADALRREVADAWSVASLRSTPATVTAGGRSGSVTAIGVTAEWRSTMNVRIASGRWLIDSDLRERRRVVVIGAGVADGVFAGTPAVGELMKIGADWYRVVGVMAARTDPGAAGAVSRFDLQHSVVVPLTALDTRLGVMDGANRVEDIVVRARSADRVSTTAAAIAAVLKRRVPSGAVEIVVPRELVAARLRARRTFDAVFVSIGALAVGISGIGIMNVMLAGVARRTAEIGVRRAVGARAADIVAQFTAESALLGALGGTAGLPLGAALSSLLGAAAGWPTALSAGTMTAAWALSAAVGMVFGVYPARVAARWTPCEALRVE